MRSKKTKAELRAELQEQIDHYLKSGGQVTEVPRGKSGVEPGELIRPVFHDGKPKETRTPCDQLLKQIDSRKQVKGSSTKQERNRRPKRRVIYDDFGEPLREVWE